MGGWEDIKLPVETAETSAVDQNRELPMCEHMPNEQKPAASQLRNAVRSCTSTWATLLKEPSALGVIDDVDREPSPTLTYFMFQEVEGRQKVIQLQHERITSLGPLPPPSLLACLLAQSVSVGRQIESMRRRDTSEYMYRNCNSKMPSISGRR